MGFNDNSKGQCIYWPNRRSITVEFDVKFIRAPDPPLLEGELQSGPILPLGTEDNQHESDATPELDEPVKEDIIEPVDEQIPTPLSPLTLLPGSPINAAQPDLPQDDRDRNKSLINPIDIIPGQGRMTRSQRIVNIPTKDQVNSLDIEGEFGTGSHEVAMATHIAQSEGMDPITLKEVYGRADRLQWEEAMKDEINRLTQRNTWKVVKKPEGINVVGSKWVFRLKKDANGETQAYRARLVAQGNYQIDGIDVFDTFSPVARLASIRTVLALTARLDWEIHQVDVRSTYLYGELTPDEIIYLRPPPGMKICQPDEVLLLKKALYGLKQSGHHWYQVLTKILNEIGLKRCNVDCAVFYRHSAKGIIILLAHVDDLTIAATSLKLINKVKQGIRKHVEITDMGEIHWMLGIKIRHDHDTRTIALSQQSYIESIISRYNFDDL